MHQRVPFLAGLTFFWLAGLAQPAAAQVRQGLWFGASGGVGSASVTCTDCESAGRETSGVVSLRAGGTLSTRVLVGGEFTLWAKTVAFEDDAGVDATFNLYNLSGTVTVYPSATSGFFVKAGAGVALADVDFAFDGASITVDVGSGLGLVAGVGIDVPITRRVSFTPAVNYWYGALGDARFGGQPVLDRVRHNVIDFSVGITIH